MVAHLRQSFTLRVKKGAVRDVKAAGSRCARYSLVYSLALVEENSPHAEFCFPFRTQSSPAGTERVKLVIIGISAVGGYKLGTYNPQHSHTNMHNQMQTPNK